MSVKTFAQIKHLLLTFFFTGSQEYEEQRLKDFLGLPKLQEDDIISVSLSSAATLPLFRQILMSGTEQCNILVFT